jgi:hypothetical protein
MRPKSWLAVAAISVLATAPALAGDAGRWATDPPAIRAWFQQLKQPDDGISCCGSGDAYGVSYDVENGQVVATIVDQRGNPLPLGTKVVIPPNKVNKDPNPTGEAIAFLQGIKGERVIVWCFVPAGGV